LAKPDPALGYLNGQLRFWLGWAQEVASDHSAAQESWRQARSELEVLLKEQPENYLLVGDLALINMGLADKAAALPLAEQAMAANPIEKDAVSGPISIEILARVAAQAAEPDRAIAALQKLLSIPYDGALAAGIPITPAILRLDPMFDPLRVDPRFQKLVASGALIPEKSVAVLPFENRSEDKANAYFADGVQDEILTRLSKIGDLKVISRTSTQRYKNTPLSLAEIAKQLGVANLLEGSVQKANDQVRVNVQLIRAANDSHLWAETYDRKVTDIFAVETEIAKAIAENLAAKLTHTEERAVSVKPTNNLAAYELYLKGRYFWNKRDREGFRRAIELFTKATELDPNYALAYAGIADTYALLPIYGFASAKDSFPKAKVAALKALRLDDTLAEAHASYGNVLLSDFDWVRSRHEFERAIELNPNYATARHWLGSDNLIDCGELDRGLAEVRRARELDPLSPLLNTILGIAHYTRREYADAVRQFHKTFEIDPNFLLAHAMLGQTLVMQGAIDEGIAETQKARQLNGDVGGLSILGYAYARKGDREQALKILAQMKAESQKEFVPAVEFAVIYIGLGDKEQALDWLEKGYEDRSSSIIKIDPICDPLHGDPRYERLVARIFSEKPASADF
jgi:TolB-like protein